MRSDQRKLPVMQEEEVLGDVEPRARADAEVGIGLGGAVERNGPVRGGVEDQVAERNVVGREVTADSARSPSYAVWEWL